MLRSADQPSLGSAQPLSTTCLVAAGFVALAVAMGIGRFAFTPVLPMMRHEGALSITGAAWLASANYAGYLAGALLPLLIRIPIHRGIRWGLVIICLGTSAMGFVQTACSYRPQQESKPLPQFRKPATSSRTLQGQRRFVVP
jgi:hypothetical protein